MQPCKLYTGRLNNGGYGPHRQVWIKAHGPIADGLHVCHRCDVRSCIELEHLFLGTRSDNMRDCLDKGRQGAARLTASHASAVRCLYVTGSYKQIELAARFGVKQPQISRIIRGACWL